MHGVFFLFLILFSPLTVAFFYRADELRGAICAVRSSCCLLFFFLAVIVCEALM
jgi:hypothetical protein